MTSAADESETIAGDGAPSRLRFAMWMAMPILGLAGFAAVLLYLHMPAPETPLQRADRHYNYLTTHGGSAGDLCEVSREGEAAAVDANAPQLDFVSWQQRVLLHCEMGDAPGAVRAEDLIVENTGMSEDAAGDALNEASNRLAEASNEVEEASSAQANTDAGGVNANDY